MSAAYYEVRLYTPPDTGLVCYFYGELQLIKTVVEKYFRHDANRQITYLPVSIIEIKDTDEADGAYIYRVVLRGAVLYVRGSYEVLNPFLTRPDFIGSYRIIHWVTITQEEVNEVLELRRIIDTHSVTDKNHRCSECDQLYDRLHYILRDIRFDRPLHEPVLVEPTPPKSLLSSVKDTISSYWV